MIRPVHLSDAKAITDIHNYYIQHSVANLEEHCTPVSIIEERIKLTTTNFPWLVYELNNKVIGYAYASDWKPRSGYKKTAETTVYIKHGIIQRGIGTALYKELIQQLKELSFKELIGGISLPHPQSVGLHEKMGFEKVAHFKRVGYKFDQWVDVGYWQLSL
ncbi:MAG: GNAT family N-acetyltransferase [Flavobacteriaceae bacterium]